MKKSSLILSSLLSLSGYWRVYGKKSFVSLLSTFLFLGLASAQTEKPQEIIEVKSVAVADIALVDATTTVKGNIIEGAFALQGNMGRQNDIVYGIIVHDKKQQIVDIKTLGKVDSIQEGELKKFTYGYTVPPSITGDVTFNLVVENTDGLPLGFKELTKKSLVGSTKSLICKTNSEGNVGCTSLVDTTLVVSYMKGSVLGTAYITETKEIKKNVEVTLMPALTAGKYVAIIRSLQGEISITPFSIAGSYGTIRNIAVHTNASGTVEVVIMFSGSHLNEYKVSATLKSATGSQCIQIMKELTSPVLIFDMSKTCNSGTVIVELKNKEGKVIDTKTETFSVLTYIEQDEFLVPVDGVHSKQSWYLSAGTKITVGGTILLLLCIIFFMRKHKAVVVAVFFLQFALLGTSGQHVSALTQSLYLYSVSVGEFAWNCDLVTSLDKSSYVPGATAIISTSGHIYADAGSNGGNGNCGSSYYRNLTDTTAAFDVDTLGSLSTISMSGSIPRETAVGAPVSFSGSTSFVVPVALSVGAHTIRFIRSSLGGPVAGSPVSGVPSNSSPLPITIVAPTPTVQVWFN